MMYSTLRKCLPFLLVVLSSVKPFVVDKYNSVLQNSNLDSSFAALEIQNLLKNENFGSLELSEKCTKDLTLYRTGIQDRVMWAMKMLDASSKVPTGILQGNIMDLGNYDECVTVDNADIQGRHCTYTLSVADNNIPLIMKPTLSYCLPASCYVKDLELLVNSTIAINPTFQKFGISPGFASCSRVEPLKWSWAGIITLSLLAIVCLFVVFCTILDILYSPQTKEGGFLNAACKFSMYTNGRKIFETKASPNIIPALQGMRSLSMLWVFLAHQYIVGAMTPAVNSVEIVDWIISWRATYIFTAVFSVDTFFTISGFLASYAFLKRMTERKNMNVFNYYLHRYIRLTPSLIVTLILSMYLLPRLGSGPGWDYVMSFVSDTCHQNWWAIILYIQNTATKGNVCLIHTWYLAVDMQLFWISPIIMYPLARKPKIGLRILGLFFLFSIVAPILLFIYGDHHAIIYDLGMNYSELVHQFAEFYAVTYTRAAPWIIGIYLGYEIVMKKPRKFSKIESSLLWFFTIMAFGFCIYGHHFIMQTPRSSSMIFKIIYVGLSKPFWAAGIAWMIYACVHGYGGIINSIFSMPIFFPLSKISYSFYLLHIVVHIMRLATTRTMPYFSLFNIISVTVFDIVTAFVLALVFNLSIELPIIILEKLVLRKYETSKSVKRLCTDNSKETTEIIKKEM